MRGDELMRDPIPPGHGEPEPVGSVIGAETDTSFRLPLIAPLCFKCFTHHTPNEPCRPHGDRS